MGTPGKHLSSAVGHAPGHPLCLAATALLVLNDNLLKARFPGLLTGKLSDVAWLVAAPVALATVLALARVPARWARAGALAGVGVAFAALQLWPPLGDAWCAIFGGHHVADAGDLCCLPALAGAWLCWRGAWIPSAPRRWALVVAAGACIASDGPEDVSWRWPCDGTTGSSPAAPMVLHWADVVHIDLTAPGLPESFFLRDQDGERTPLLLSFRGDGTLVLCPEGGLAPARTYSWWARNTVYSAHHLAGPDISWIDPWAFTTGPADGVEPVRNQADCDALALPDEAEQALGGDCDPCREDTGRGSCRHGRDTGETGETGDGGAP